MGIRRDNIVPYSRDYRRAPRLGMGLPPDGSRRRRRVTDPRTRLRAVVVVASLGLVLLPLAADAWMALAGARAADGCRVVSVVDGDTVRLWCPGRGVFAARMTGFDTPEVFSPSCVMELAAGLAATVHLRSLLLTADRLSVGFRGQDRYGRALVSLATEGGSIAGLMIAAGHARPYAGGPRPGWCE